MHPGIVCADVAMGRIQGTVEYLHLRILNGCLHTGLHQGRRGGKDQVTA